MIWPEPIGFSSAASAIAALALAFAAAALLSLALTPLLRDAALRWGWLDRPDGRRKLHTAAVPPVGGLAVLLALACGFFLPLAVLPGLAWSSTEQGDPALHLLVATAGVALVGLLDDIRALTPWVKLLAQVAAGLHLYNHGYDVRVISNPLGDPFTLGWLSLPLTLLWIVGLSNAFNLIDGLDGLATGVGLFATSVVFIFALLNEGWEIALVSAALAGALLGFLRYNFSPASVFLGDSGSLSIGFVLAALSLRGSTKSSMVVAVVAPLLALGFPIVDTAMAMLRRLLAGRSIMEADADHIHHRMLRLGLRPRQAVMMLYAVTALFGAMALLATTGHADAVAFAVLSFAAVTWTGIRRLASGSAKTTAALEGVRSRLRTATGAAEAWALMVETAELLRLQRLVLRLEDGNGGATRVWDAHGGPPATDALTWTLPLSDQGARVGELLATRASGAPAPPAAVPALLEALAPELAQAVMRR